MATVEVSCPNCGASDGVLGPHKTRICKYCGTHYLLDRPKSPKAEEAGEELEDQAVEKDRISAILIAFGVVAILILIVVIAVLANREEEAPANDWPFSEYTPRR